MSKTVVIPKFFGLAVLILGMGVIAMPAHARVRRVVPCSRAGHVT